MNFREVDEQMLKAKVLKVPFSRLKTQQLSLINMKSEKVSIVSQNKKQKERKKEKMNRFRVDNERYYLA